MNPLSPVPSPRRHQLMVTEFITFTSHPCGSSFQTPRHFLAAFQGARLRNTTTAPGHGSTGGRSFLISAHTQPGAVFLILFRVTFTVGLRELRLHGVYALHLGETALGFL